MEWIIIVAVVVIIFLPSFLKKKKNNEKTMTKDDLNTLNPTNNSDQQILKEAKGKKRTLTFTNCHNYLFAIEDERKVNDFSYADFIKVISEIEFEFIENDDVYESGISDDVFYAYEDFLSEKIDYENYNNDFIQKIEDLEEEAKLYINNSVNQKAIVKSIKSEILIPDFDNFTSGTDVIEDFYEFKGFNISYKIEYSYKNIDSEYIKKLISIKINYDIQQNMFGSSNEEIMNFNSKEEKGYLLDDLKDFSYSFTLPEKMIEINNFSIKYEKNKVNKSSKNSSVIKKDKSLNKERSKFLYVLNERIKLLPNRINLAKDSKNIFTNEGNNSFQSDYSQNTDDFKHSMASDDLFNDKMEIKIDGFDDKK